MQQVPYLVAFGAGLASFLTPCVLPMVPVYLASLCGPDVLAAQGSRRRWPVLIRAAGFVIGFSLVFVALGLAAGTAGLVLGSLFTALPRLAGGLLILFGLFMLASLKIPWLNVEKRLSSPLGGTRGALRPLLIGALFSFAWTPCVGPILGSILALAMSTETAPYGASLMAAYSLGLGVPFLVIAVALDSFLPLLKRLNRHSRIVYIISGILLMGVGLLMVTNRLNWLSAL